VPIEEYGDQIGHHIVPTIGGAGEIVKAWPGAMVFHEYGLYPSEQAILWVAKLGQPSKEGEVVDVVVRRTRSAPMHCHALSDGGVAADAAHGRACHP
jgi:hypothetical protein